MKNSAFEEVSRTMILELQKDMCEVKKDLNEIKTVYVNRLPVWGSVILAFAGTIIGVLAGLVL